MSERIAKIIVTVAMLFATIGTIVLWSIQRDERSEVVWQPGRVEWASAPVLVYVDKSLADWSSVIDAGIHNWNSRIGCTFLLRTDDESVAQVRMHMVDGTICGRESVGVAVDEGDGKPASTWYCNGWVDTQFRALDEVGLGFRRLDHELGHDIGLAHDRDGAMSTAALDPQPDDPPEYWLPNNKDVAAIRARWCP